jgi:hypothetical protein
MADSEKKYSRIRVEHDEPVERVFRVGAEGVEETSEVSLQQPVVPAAQVEPASAAAEEAAAPRNVQSPAVQTPVEPEEGEPVPDVPFPKMRVGVLIAMLILVIICVAWFAGMRMGLV